MKTIGKVLAQQPMMFTSRIGEASNGEYKMTILVTEPLRHPMIVHEDGRAFVLEWDDIITMAAMAFDANKVGI